MRNEKHTVSVKIEYRSNSGVLIEMLAFPTVPPNSQFEKLDAQYRQKGAAIRRMQIRTVIEGEVDISDDEFARMEREAH